MEAAGALSANHDDGEPVAEPTVSVVEQDGLIILSGPSELVAELVSTDLVLRDAAPLAVTGGAAAGALAQLAELISAPGADQVAFQLDDKGAEMYRQGSLVAQGDGWMRTFGKAADGTFSGHAAIKPLLLAPQQVLTAQLAITTMALTAAIKEVQEAVERVERKVDVLKDLVEADRVGAILGAHRTLHRRAEQLEFTGSMSDTDWNAIDGLGVEVEQQIEVLRSFVRKRLQAAQDEGMRIAERRDAISYVEELAETLKLLVVAQDNLFLYQQLRLARIRDREPHLLQPALVEANALLVSQHDEDVRLLTAVRDIVAGRVEVKALEIHRFMSIRAVVATAGSIDESLTSFAGQRTLAYDAIEVSPVPTVAQAVDELRDRGSAMADGAKALTNQIVHRVRDSDSGAAERDDDKASSVDSASLDADEAGGEAVSSMTSSVAELAANGKQRFLSRFRRQDSALGPTSGVDQAEASRPDEESS